TVQSAAQLVRGPHTFRRRSHGGLAQLTSFLASSGVQPSSRAFSVVASCGLLPRTTRPGPPVWTAFWSVANLPLRDTRESCTWSAAITECNVILSEASLRAQSKDPHLVGSSAWVADPSQAQCHPERSEPAS